MIRTEFLKEYSACYLRNDQRDRNGSSESTVWLVGGGDGCTQRGCDGDRGGRGIGGLFQGCHLVTGPDKDGSGAGHQQRLQGANHMVMAWAGIF